MSDIESGLVKFRRRIRILRAWKGFAIGGTAAAVVAAVWAVLDYFRLFYTEWLWLGILVAFGAFVGAVIGFIRKLPASSVAESVDRRARLEDRLSTAIEGQNAESTFIEVQHQDAAGHLQGLRPARVYPLRFSRWHASLMIACVLAASLFLLGNSPLLLSDQQKRDRKELQDVSNAVERVAKPLLDEPDKTAKEEQLARDIERYRQELKRGRMSKEEALQKADELSEQAKKLAQERFEQTDAGLDTAQAALDKFAKAQLDKAGLQNVDPSLLKNTPEENAQEADALTQALSKLQQQLQSGKGENGQKLSAKDIAALKDKMSELQKQLDAIKLSQKAQDFLKRLYEQPEWKKLMEMMREARKLAQTGRAGAPNLTAEQVKQMIKELEKLADRLKSDKDMQDFIKQLEAALKSGCGG